MCGPLFTTNTETSRIAKKLGQSLSLVDDVRLCLCRCLDLAGAVAFTFCAPSRSFTDGLPLLVVAIDCFNCSKKSYGKDLHKLHQFIIVNRDPHSLHVGRRLPLLASRVAIGRMLHCLDARFAFV